MAVVKMLMYAWADGMGETLGSWVLWTLCGGRGDVEEWL